MLFPSLSTSSVLGVIWILATAFAQSVDQLEFVQIQIAGDPSPFGERQQDDEDEPSEEFNPPARFSGEGPDFGDLSCMRWTGGTCAISPCKSTRGQTLCAHGGKCMCAEGFCASPQGKCVAQHGRWLNDSFTIRFVHPVSAERPYLGAAKSGYGKITHVLAALANSTPSWRIALVGTGGLVRFESVLPGHSGRVMTVFANRRRRSDASSSLNRDGNLSVQSDSLEADDTLSVQSDSLEAAHGSSNISEDFPSFAMTGENIDLWPAVRLLSAVTPNAATFQLRELEEGVEIWDPQRRVSLITVSSKFYKDRAAKKGIGECSPYKSMFNKGCNEDREAVSFEPELPVGVVSTESRIKIKAISKLYTWQKLLMAVLFVLCVWFCGFIRRSR